MTYTANAGAFTGGEVIVVSASETDTAGNVGTSNLSLNAIDTTTPSALAITTADATSNNLSQTISGTGEVGSTITVYDGATVVGTAVVNANGNWATAVTLSGQGQHTLTATSTDAAGNTTASTANGTATSQDVVITIDTTAPVVNLVRVADGQRIVFASDRVGGSGGWDLWQATWQDARWSDPRPLPLDTAADEVDPFLDADGRWLYFASNRSGGRGPRTAHSSGPAAGVTGRLAAPRADESRAVHPARPLRA